VRHLARATTPFSRPSHPLPPSPPPTPASCRRRESDVVVVPFGTAYLQVSALAEAPPTRYKTGARIATPFGRGRIRELRRSEERIDYVVSLLDCRLTGDQPATGYLAPDKVSERAQLQFEEIIEDANGLRNRGNEAFKGREFDVACFAYGKCVEILEQTPRELSEEQRDALRDAIVKALSNLTMAFLAKPDPSFAAARRAATEVRKRGEGEGEARRIA
jgi:hypothetical protein